MANTYINWNLISELYDLPVKEIDMIQEVMTKAALANVGWKKDTPVAAHQYKKMWAITACCEPLSDVETDRKIQWGYDIINKHMTQ